MPLTIESIDNVVTRTSAGVYVLGPPGRNGGVLVFYVGRSDHDLNDELKHHAGEFTHFAYAYSGSAIAAFLAECELYHQFNPRWNFVHPAPPADENWKCPRCSY